jgi:hypothetical protein
MDTAPRADQPHTRAAPSTWVFFCLSTLLTLSPLIRGGNRQLAIALLVATALCALAGLITQWLTHSSHPSPPKKLWTTAIWLLATSPLWLGILHLTPLPADLWSQLAGRHDYLSALSHIGQTPASHLPLSLNPGATRAALWSALPASIAFIAAVHLQRRETDRLLAILLAAAAIQILIAVLQIGGGKTSFFYFGSPHISSVIGTFNNRNHLADFLGMCVPLWFYFALRTHNKHRSGIARLIPRNAWWPLWITFGFAIIVVLLLTQSRGGLLSTSIALIGCGWLMLRTQNPQLNPRLRWATIAALALTIIAALIAVGLEDIAKRIQTERLIVDANVRNAYTHSTLQAAQHFWPWGSGIGTFESAFPRFQNLQTLGYVEYAHNDYPQLLMELGIFTLPLAAAALYLITHQLRQLKRQAQPRKPLRNSTLQRQLAGLGALVLLLHSNVEFNMHIPALAITAAFLAGVYLRPTNTPGEED